MNDLDNKKEYKLILFIFGIFSSFFLYSISRTLDIFYELSLSPQIYMFYIPIIVGFIAQKFAIKFLILEFKQLILFEKGVLFYFLASTSYIVLYALFFRQPVELLAYRFIIYCSPLLTYTFLSWIYYYIGEIKIKAFEIMNTEIVVEENYNDEPSDENKEEDNKNKNDEENDILNSANNFVKKLSDKISKNINKK